jgi:uncharacterized membrane protein YedE/YeeE
LFEREKKNRAKKIMFSWPELRTLAAYAAAGLLFGFGNEKSRGHSIQGIYTQLNWSHHALLKLFCAGMSGSLLAFATLHSIPAFRRKAQKAFQFTTDYDGRSWQTSALGGALIGAGMAISGSCPGMGAVQLGAGYASAVYTIAGGCAGAFAWSAFLHRPQPRRNELPLTLHGLLGVSYPVAAFGAGIAMAGFVAGVEYLTPWNGPVEAPYLVPVPLPSPAEHVGILSLPAWPAWVGGITLGLAQIILVLFGEVTLGCARAFEFPGAVIGQRWSEYCKSVLRQPAAARHTMVAYFAFVTLGSFISSKLSGTYGAATDVPGAYQFVGSFLYIFGARMSGGCTSGHGLSGFGTLHLQPIIATMMMFVGGIPTALVMTYGYGMKLPGLSHF